MSVVKEKCTRCEKEIKDNKDSYLTVEGRICSKCYEKAVNDMDKVLQIVTDLQPDVCYNRQIMDD